MSTGRERVKLNYIRVKLHHFIVVLINGILKHELIQVFVMQEIRENRLKKLNITVLLIKLQIHPAIF